MSLTLTLHEKNALVVALADELFAHDQGFAPSLIENDEEREEYEAVTHYVRAHVLPLIERTV